MQYYTTLQSVYYNVAIWYYTVLYSIREFKDVVFEDVVFDNNRFDIYVAIQAIYNMATKL